MFLQGVVTKTLSKWGFPFSVFVAQKSEVNLKVEESDRLTGVQSHRVGRARTSDWLNNSFIIVVYENFFKVQPEFSVESTNKKTL